MTDRITKLQGKNRLTRDALPSSLLLFPLCDERGCLSTVLCQPAASSDDQRSENIFFAWLLDLPATIDARDAAEAILLVAESLSPELPASAESSNGEALHGCTGSRGYNGPGLKQELRRMLEKVIEERSIEEPESLSGIISQVVKLDRE